MGRHDETNSPSLQRLKRAYKNDMTQWEIVIIEGIRKYIKEDKHGTKERKNTIWERRREQRNYGRTRGCKYRGKTA